jgi:hypothetical protein
VQFSDEIISELVKCNYVGLQGFPDKLRPKCRFVESAPRVNDPGFVETVHRQNNFQFVFPLLGFQLFSDRVAHDLVPVNFGPEK